MTTPETWWFVGMTASAIFALVLVLVSRFSENPKRGRLYITLGFIIFIAYAIYIKSWVFIVLNLIILSFNLLDISVNSGGNDGSNIKNMDMPNMQG